MSKRRLRKGRFYYVVQEENDMGMMRLWVGFPKVVDRQTKQCRLDSVVGEESRSGELLDASVPGQWLRNIPNNTDVALKLVDIDGNGLETVVITDSILVLDTIPPGPREGGFTFNQEEEDGSDPVPPQ